MQGEKNVIITVDHKLKRMNKNVKVDQFSLIKDLKRICTETKISDADSFLI